MFKNLFRNYHKGQTYYYKGDKNFGVVILYSRGFGRYVVMPFSDYDKLKRSQKVLNRWELLGYV